jgi:hypothetical protein
VLPLLWKYAHYTLVVLEVLTAPVGSWHQVWLEHFRWIALSGGAWVDAWARGCRFKWWKGRLVERLDDPSDEHRAGSDGGVGAGMTQPDHSTSSYSALAKAGLPPNKYSFRRQHAMAHSRTVQRLIRIGDRCGSEPMHASCCMLHVAFCMV